MRRVLITGKNSYIGSSLENWVATEPDEFKVDTVDMRDGFWQSMDFSVYDSVFHVAGIAHVSTNPNMKDSYYKVNRDLAIETAKKAKAEGVKQFIFMSSIIVYGDSSSNDNVINRKTIPKPSNFYGSSKLQAEEGLMLLNCDIFKIVILRPPMIYGRGSRGNYPKLSMLSQKLPIFPDFDNARSMLHIDNLCEFIKLLIENDESGLFFPQNSEYVKTTEMVKLIAEVHNKKIWFTRIFNPIIRLLIKHIKVIDKMFGNFIYDLSISDYKKGNYQIRNFSESIQLTEK